MSLKILEAHVPQDLADRARDALGEVAQEVWVQPGGRFGTVVRAVIGAERSGAAMDRLHAELSDHGGLMVLVEPLDAVLPRPLASALRETRHEARSSAAVSREEVFANIADTAKLTPVYLAMVVLASVVAGIGLARNNTAAVIGAMVVAPLLGPAMALALGLVLGDLPLAWRALRTNAVGLLVAVAGAALLGLALQPDPSVPEIASRTRVGLSDLVLALAAGCAGALSYTTGVPAYLTGVMVAVALLPPAVAGGLLAVTADPRGALAALLLAGANVTALVLAAMLTFLWRGMRPRNWWQEAQARTSARWGVAVFVALFLGLAVLIVASQRFFEG